MASSEEPQDAEVQDVAPSNVLQFDDPLSWKAGSKAIPAGTLIKRLTELSKKLSDLEQEDVDRESLETPAKELAHVHLIQHPHEGVKAYTACCLADILRLHAPDAPYTAQQLKEIFQLFVKQLKHLADPESPYYQQYLYLLESLSQVKSVVLISDIPDSEQITLNLFTSFFDIAKPDGSKNVEYHMTDILVQLIDECNQLPTDVVDIVIAQFLRAVPNPVQTVGKKTRGAAATRAVEDRQTKLVSSVPPPAYNMAKTICNSCVDKMARHICQYFSEVIVDAASGSGGRKGEDDDADAPPPSLSHEALVDLNKAHLLAKELWKACPAVLQNVIPQLEQELLAENAELRELATETIGEMALTGNFGSSAPATWKVWVGRANDKSSSVRAKWVEAGVRIIKERSDGMAVNLTDLVAVKLNDLDEKVRFIVCKALRTLDYQCITSKLAAEQSPFNIYDSSTAADRPVTKKSKTEDESPTGWGKRILQNLGERVRDKKIQVRLEGMRCLARMWEMAYKDIAAGNEVVIGQLGWIPSKILDTFYINDSEVNVLLDHVLHEILIPVNYPPIEKEKYGLRDNNDTKANGKKGKDKDGAGDKEREKEVLEGDRIRVRRLLVLVKGLDPKAKRALFAVPMRQISYAKVMEVYLKACEDFNGGVFEEGVDETAVKTTLDKFSHWLSQKLPDPPKAKENLTKFAKLHDRRCYQLIRFCFSPESDYRTVVRALKEIKKRIGESTMSGILDSLTPLLYRVSQLIYNKSHVAPIVEFSRTDEYGLASTAHEVLKEMSTNNAAVFKANVKALSDLLTEQSPGSGKHADATGAVDTLKACAGFAKSYPKELPQERKLLQVLVSFALTGTPPAAAKHAVTILMFSANRKEMYAADLIKRCIKDFRFGEEHFLAKLACLGQLVLLAPDQCEEEAAKIIDIARDVLLKVRTASNAKDEEGEDEWCEESQLDDEAKAKLLALRILVNRLRAHTDAQSVENIAPMVMRVLVTTIGNEGELSKNKDTPKTHRSRLRLAAAQLLLKLAVHKSYDDLITPADFNRLACVAQDQCYQVRRGYVDKLKKYLATRKLPSRFYTIVFLMAYEPQEDWKEEVITWIKARAVQLAKVGGNTMEGVFARFLSLMAHHPDFLSQVHDPADHAKYILFYLKAVANEDNLSLIYYVAQRVKQFRDGLSQDNSDNLYYLSDLSQALIRKYAEVHNWSIQTWPGKLRLPPQLFTPMQSAEESQEVTRRTFLPKDVDGKLDGMVRAGAGVRKTATGGRKRKSDTGAQASPTALNVLPRKRYKTEDKSVKKEKAPKKVAKQRRKRKATPEGKADEKPKERRRSGRQHKEVKYVEEFETDSGDAEMEDVDSDEESSSEEEVVEKPKARRGRPSLGRGGRKNEPKKEKDEEEGEEKEQEKEDEKEDGEDVSMRDAAEEDATTKNTEALDEEPESASAEKSAEPEPEAQEPAAEEEPDKEEEPKEKTPKPKGRGRRKAKATPKAKEAKEEVNGKTPGSAASGRATRSTRSTRNKPVPEEKGKEDNNDSSDLSEPPSGDED